MPSDESLEIDNNFSISPFVHDIQRFHAIIVYTDFIDNTILGDAKPPVLKSFPIDKPHFETTQGQNPNLSTILNFGESSNTHFIQYLFYWSEITQRRTTSFFITWIHPLISPFQEDGEIVTLTTFQYIFFRTLPLNGWLYKPRVF